MPTTCRTWTRDMPDRSRVVANAELRIDDTSGLSDGFSITGEVYLPHGTWSGAAQQRNGREADIGGCVHDQILRAFPALAPLVAVHLCDPDGTPMHARANGWYFYSGAAAQYVHDHNPGGLTDLERAARALHIPAADLPAGMDREAFDLFVTELAPRWQAVADTARAILEAA